MNKVRIYACGGTGITLGSRFDQREPQGALAGTETVYVDTSRSNLPPQLKDDANAYILKNLDGSGKIRADNSAPIVKSIGELVLAHRPAAFNIVIFGTAGGSGSVFGPLLVKHLLDNDHPVVCIAIGALASEITARNTLNTLKTLDSLRAAAQAPLIMHYQQNPLDAPRTEVDNNAIATIQLLLLLASGKNNGLDTRDVRNFLRYDLACGVPPSLACLEVFCGNDLEQIQESGVKHCLSLATIHQSQDFVPLRLRSSYQCEGFRPADAQLDEQVPGDVHFLVHTDDVEAIVASIKKVTEEYEELKRLVAPPSAVARPGEADDNGLIL